MQQDPENLLMSHIIKFYNQKKYINKLLTILKPELNNNENINSKISLRLIDWFITNYAKKYNINIIKDNNFFNIYLSYKAQLKAYSKKYFDPFRRRQRIKFNYGDNNYIETTIGQLNLFKWLFQNNIIEYIQNNVEKIENDMFSSHKKNKKKIISKNMNLYLENRIIHFE